MASGKPVTEVGTWGRISVRHVRPGAYRSRARIRDQDGTTRQVTATGTTRAAAERALRKKLADRTVPTQLALTRETTVRALADFWLERLQAEERVESSTINEYQRILDKVVLPEIGGLRLRELSTSRLEHFLIGVRQTSINRQRKAKVVLGSMLGVAVGKGTYRKGSPKSDAGYRTLVLPDFAVALLRRRQRASDAAPDKPVFATRNGTWQQVTNVERRWREIRQGTELEWVTPHTFRKTVATLISERVGAETAAQQLGHSSPEITREFYIAKPAIAADVAHVLSELAEFGPG